MLLSEVMTIPANQVIRKISRRVSEDQIEELTEHGDGEETTESKCWSSDGTIGFINLSHCL